MRFWQCHDQRFSKNDFRIYPVFLNRRPHEADIYLPEPQPLQLFVCRQLLPTKDKYARLFQNIGAYDMRLSQDIQARAKV
jgi:hypothetical protein